MLHPDDLIVSTLGPARFPSPLKMSTVRGDGVGNFVRDDARVPLEIEFSADDPPAAKSSQGLAFERAGAREKLFFDPAKTKAAIVTCGGLSPGLNDVIRSAFFQLHANYKVPEVYGIRYGYRGLNPEVGEPPRLLDGDFVEEIHKIGGTVLGSSRGRQPTNVIVDFLQQRGINILICIGGDGTQRGAHAIYEEVRRRELATSVVGIPKTIDNDIPYVWQSFGFDTALDKAIEHLTGAHNEAIGVPGGIGLVKLMGRHAGFIAAGATLAGGQVNFTLIPEEKLVLEGENGFLARLHRRLVKRNHAVVVVAEGAGQDLIPLGSDRYRRGGSSKLGDIGLFLKDRIAEYFDREEVEANVKYFDPSYHIRSLPANCSDRLFCNQLARCAVHAAMAGKTDILVGSMHNLFIHVPLPLVTESTKQVDLESDLWIGVLATTAQEQW